jgi:hypothetical protein
MSSSTGSASGSIDALSPKAIVVEVACAMPDRQILLRLPVPAGTTMSEAVRISGILQQCPEIDAETATLGIFSRIEKAPARRVLQEGDRVEIYRPLLIDPMEARRARAARAKKKRAP